MGADNVLIPRGLIGVQGATDSPMILNFRPLHSAIIPLIDKTEEEHLRHSHSLLRLDGLDLR